MSPGTARTHGIEPWFLRRGLPYFVEGERARARSAIRPRQLVPLAALVALAGLGAAGGLTWLTRGVDEQVSVSVAPAALTAVLLIAAAVYFVTAMRARPIVTWALRRTAASVSQLVPMVTRALPLLLLFVTFLFINAEVWQLSSYLDGAVMWLTILLFGALAVLFLLVRLPEEVDRIDDEIDLALVRRATTGTPIEADTRRLLETEGVDARRLATYGDVTGWERRNLILVLLITQVAQVVLLSLSVFAFFLVFGGLVMNEVVQETWTGQPVTSLAHLENLSVELVQVSTFLASFSGLYFTVGVVTDDNYREQFFSEVLGELESAVGVRAAYLALLAADRGALPPPSNDDATAEPPAESAAGPAGSPDELVGHWSFRQVRADDISDGEVSGELVLLGDGRLFRRHGGPSVVRDGTRWDFGPWHAFTGWRPIADEAAAREELARRGYLLAEPGPLTPRERRGGPYPGPTPQDALGDGPLS